MPFVAGDLENDSDFLFDPSIGLFCRCQSLIHGLYGLALHILVVALDLHAYFTQIQVTQVLIRPNCWEGGGGCTYYIKVFEANNGLANGDSLFGYYY